MAVTFLNNLTGKLQNAGSSLANALFGSANISSTGGGQYPAGIQNYLDSLENQPYMQGLLNQPKQTGLSLDQYKQGIAQGLNFGVPEIADAQDALKINKPKTAEEIEQAKTGTFNSYPLQAGLSGGARQGGLINDFMSGYRENYNNSFDANNLVPQNKSLVTRFGEGLGTVGRFMDSPLGRGILAYGLNKALGYDDSALEGITAFVGRQNSRATDKLYRDDLLKQGIDVSNIKGNITGDMYNQLLRAKQLQDNAAYRQMMADMQAENNKIQQQFRADQFNYQKQKDAEDRAFRRAQLGSENAYRNAQLGLGYARLADARQARSAANKTEKAMQKQAETIGNLEAIENQLNRFENSFNDVNNPYRYRILGGASTALNTLSPAEANFNSQRTLLFNKIARDLGGEKGVLSDQDIKRIEQSLPTLGDTTAQKKAKMNAIYNLLDDRKQSAGMYKTQNTKLNIDNDALEAELARRGL